MGQRHGLATAPPLLDSTAISWAIGLALGGTVVLHLARSFISWWTAATMGRISQEVVVALRGALHRKLMRLPMAYFDSQQTGRIMARVTSDVGSILMFIRSGIIQLISDLILSLAIAFVLVWLQWRLAIVALVAVPLYAVNQRFFFARLRRLSDEIRAQVSALYALLSERVSAVRVVRSFVKEDAELATLDERIDRHRALSLGQHPRRRHAGGSGDADQRTGDRFRDQLRRGPDRPRDDLRRRPAGVLCPGQLSFMRRS